MELDAHEYLRADRDAFLRQVGRDRMDAFEFRREPVRPARAAGACARATRSIAAGVAPRAAGYITSQVSGARLRGILADQAVQVRGARARQADDEHRRGDASAFDRGFARSLRFEAQQILEQAHEQLAYRDAAEHREVALRCGRTRAAARVAPRIGHAPKSLEPGAPTRGAPQAVDVERSAGRCRSAAARVRRVQGADRAAHAALRKAHRWASTRFASIRGRGIVAQEQAQQMTLARNPTR